MTDITLPSPVRRLYAPIHNGALTLASTSLADMTARLSARAKAADKNPLPIAKQRRIALGMTGIALLLFGLALSPLTDCAASKATAPQPETPLR